MMKKPLLIFLMWLVCSSSIASAELTRKDIAEIRAVVREEIAHVDKRLDIFEKGIDKRFEQIDKRFEQIDKRLEFLQNLMLGLLAVFGSLCGVFVGLLLWDRRTFKDKAKEEALKEIEQKWRIGDWINALKEYATNNKELTEILKRSHLL